MAVRKESVQLSLIDQGFTTGMARAAVATRSLDGALNDLDGSNVRIGDGLKSASRDIDGLGDAFRRNSADIDQFSGRLGLAIRAIGAFGPAIIPLGALGVPAIAGVVSQLGFLAGGAITATVAFQGVGDALEAVNTAQLEPTAENLAKAREAMELISPAAQGFVTQLQAMRPALAAVRDAGAEEMFPALSRSLVDLETVLPKAEGLFASFGSALGDVATMASGSLASGAFDEFISYLSAEAGPTLTAMASTAGSLAQGMSELVMAMDPLSDGFTGWLQDAAQGFEDWATGLSATDGFKEFVEYVRTTGPQVADTMGALADAVLQVVQAAAPMGGPVLSAIEGFARAIAAIADSPLGAPLMAYATAVSAIGLAARGAKVATDQFAGGLSKVQKAALAYVGLKLITDGINAIADAADGALPGTESLTGKLIDLANGDISSLGGDLSNLGDSIDRLDPNKAQAFGDAILGIGGITGMHLTDAKEDIEAIDNALVNLYNTKGPEAAAAGLEALYTTGQVTGAEFEALKGHLTGYNEALARTANEAKTTGAASESMARLLGASADAAHEAANGLEDGASAAARFADAVTDLNDLLNNRATLRDYEQALDGLNQSVKENGNTWNAAGEKGRANLQQLDSLVGTSIERVNKLRESGHELAAQKMLTRALGDLEAFRDANPRARAAMQPLFAELRKLDGTRATAKLDAEDKPARGKVNGVEGLLRVLNGKRAVPKIDAEEGAAMAGIANVRSGLASLHDKSVTITTTLRTVRTSGDTAGGAPALRAGSADGSTVPKTGLPYADRHPYLLADGEEVISNRYGQADRWRPFLKLINANRAADGDTVGGDWRDYYNPPGSTHSSSSSNRLSDNAIDRQVNALLASLNGLTAGLHGLSKKEINIRERDLERTEKQLDRLLDKREERAKKEADADKARLDSMIETQRAFEDQVAGLFKSDVFAKGDEAMFAVFPDGSRVPLENGLSGITEAQGRYMEAAGVRYETEGGAGDAAGLLQGDITRIQESLRLYRGLRERGFDGPAFRELVGAADVETLQAYAAMSRADLQQIERLYDQRDQLAGQAGQFVGKDFDPKIAELAKHSQESVAELRGIRQENRQINQRLNLIERVLNKAPKETGKAVGDAVNGAMTDGVRGR